MHAIQQYLIEKRLIDADAPWKAMQGGHSNDVWRVGERVVKRYRKNGNNPVFYNSGKDEAYAMRLMHMHDIAPACYGAQQFGPDTLLVYEYLDGDHNADPQDVANILQRVWASKPPRSFRLSSLTPADILAEGDYCNGQLRWTERVAFEQFGIETPELAISQPVFLHGDPVAGNILVTNDGLRLIDWQSPSFGDATRDVAIYLSPAMQFLYQSDTVQNDEFLKALPSEIAERYKMMQPLYHWWMERYCRWRMWQGIDANDQEISKRYGQAADIEAAALKKATK